MIPTYQRLNTSVTTHYPRKSFLHKREKCLLVLLLFSFIFVLFGGLFLLPDNFNAEKVINAYKSFQKAGPEIFIPAPPLHEDFNRQDHPDRNRLLEKINNEFNILEKPIEVNKKTDYEAGINEPPNPVIDEIQSEAKPRRLELGSDMGADSDTVSEIRITRIHHGEILKWPSFSFPSRVSDKSARR
jgi:hypothetical protein